MVLQQIWVSGMYVFQIFLKTEFQIKKKKNSEKFLYICANVSMCRKNIIAH